MGSACVAEFFNFNSHAHVERDLNSQPHTVTDFYFNSHAHVERDFTYDELKREMDISTHTLTWSVTVTKAPFSCHFPISTHTLTWSVTK